MPVTPIKVVIELHVDPEHLTDFIVEWENTADALKTMAALIKAELHLPDDIKVIELA